MLEYNTEYIRDNLLENTKSESRIYLGLYIKKYV